MSAVGDDEAAGGETGWDLDQLRRLRRLRRRLRTMPEDEEEEEEEETAFGGEVDRAMLL